MNLKSALIYIQKKQFGGALVWKWNIKQSVPEDNSRPKTASPHPVAGCLGPREKQKKRRINKRLISPVQNSGELCKSRFKFLSEEHWI